MVKMKIYVTYENLMLEGDLNPWTTSERRDAYHGGTKLILSGNFILIQLIPVTPLE